MFGFEPKITAAHHREVVDALREQIEFLKAELIRQREAIESLLNTEEPVRATAVVEDEEQKDGLPTNRQLLSDPTALARMIETQARKRDKVDEEEKDELTLTTARNGRQYTRAVTRINVKMAQQLQEQSRREAAAQVAAFEQMQREDEAKTDTKQVS